MPRFLKRIFADNPFRREQSPADDLQRTRRVLIRQAGEDFAFRDGASVAGSSTHRPILAPSLADDERLEPATKPARARRRLSKRHRRPA
ncbi:hypothetical protein EK21DRAFT_66862 [Setomelanomma holmii]|uniref:Uncharacterized protein n=1 Tax=Setomelanomma holmii TaxID=210430 RepID=A0A9P4H8S0_9PLEO|nr:hypothetical protein EK21DRAFT_66862 [Setomelanomma holmii]